MRTHQTMRLLGYHKYIKDVPDDFAPYDGEKTCQSVSGRWRPKHEWDKDDRCVFCNKEKSLL